MIAKKRKKNTQIEIVNIYATLTTSVQKRYYTIYIFSSKNITSFPQNSAGQVRVKQHTALSNGF